MFGVEGGIRGQGQGLRRAVWGEGCNQVRTCPGAPSLSSEMALLRDGPARGPCASPCAKRSPVWEPHNLHQTACQDDHALFITGAALRLCAVLQDTALLSAKVEIQSKRPASEKHGCGGNKDKPQQDSWDKTTCNRSYLTGLWIWKQLPGKFHEERASVDGSCLCQLLWGNLAVPFNITVRYRLVLYLFAYP